MPIAQIPPSPVPQTSLGLLDQILAGIRADPFGGFGLVTGAGRGVAQREMAPPLFRFLDALRRDIAITPTTLPPEIPVPSDAIVRGYTRLGPDTGDLLRSLQMWLTPFRGTRTATHEGLHGALLHKTAETSSPSAYLPQTYLDPLWTHAVRKAPQLQDLLTEGVTQYRRPVDYMKRELLIDWMAKNVMNAHPPIGPFGVTP